MRSITTYAASAWGFATKTHFNKLQVFQNKVLRIITKVPRAMPIEIQHEQTGTETIKTTARASTKIIS
jgi:hypothetical protein